MEALYGISVDVGGREAAAEVIALWAVGQYTVRYTQASCQIPLARSL